MRSAIAFANGSRMSFGAFSDKNSGQQCGLRRVTKQRKLFCTQLRRNLSRNFGECKCRANQQGSGNGAFSNWNHGIRAPAAITRVALRIESEANAIAIAPSFGFRTGKHIEFERGVNTAALQRLAQDRLLERKLRRVVCVLILASAADSKVAARGRHAFCGGRDNLHHFAQLRIRVSPR